MAELRPGQFELGGVVFGAPGDVAVVPSEGFDKGSASFRAQDVPSPVGDTMLFGRDRLTPAEWSLDLVLSDPVDVRPMLSQLAAVWRGDAVRLTPGATMELRYNEHGVTRVVRGRPRRFSIVPEDVADVTFRLASASFQLVDVNIYSDALYSVLLGLVTTSTSEGTILPAVLPWTLGNTTATERRGIVTVAGSVPTPLSITISGPTTGQASGVVLAAPGWRVALTEPVASGDTIVIDTGTGTMTKNGSPYMGISRDSSLSLRLAPGPTEFLLQAQDPSASLTALVAWRSADPLI